MRCSGVLLAWAVGNLVGLTALAVVGPARGRPLVGAMRWFREESTAVAATGLIVLTTGFSTHDAGAPGPALRHLDRHRRRAGGQPGGVAAAAGLLRGPGHRRDRRRRRRAAARHGRRAAGQPCTEDAGDRVGRPHPRPRRGHRPGLGAAAAGQGERPAQPAPRGAGACETTDVFEEILRDNEQAVAESRSMARTLGHSIERVVEWEPEFRDRWLALLREAGEAIGVPDSVRVDPGARRPDRRSADDLSDRGPVRPALAGVRRADHEPAQRGHVDGPGRRAEPGRAAPLREARPAAPA